MVGRSELFIIAPISSANKIHSAFKDSVNSYRNSLKN